MGTNSNKAAEAITPNVKAQYREKYPDLQATDAQIAAASALVSSSVISLLMMPEAQMASMAGGSRGLNMFLTNLIARYYVPEWIAKGVINAETAESEFEALADEALAFVGEDRQEAGIFDR